MNRRPFSAMALILGLALFAQVCFGASFAERDGMVVIEAEHYDNLRADTVSGVTWELRNDVDNFLEGPTSHGEYMYVPTNSNDDNFSDFDQVVIDEAPRMDYKAEFITGGTYYIWVRGNEEPGNSYHFGIDGTITGVRPQGYGDWVWWNDDRDVDPVAQLDIAPVCIRSTSISVNRNPVLTRLSSRPILILYPKALGLMKQEAMAQLQ